MFGYIYLTTNLINGKKYVGLHESPVFTEDYKGSGKIIKLAFEKYGWDNFKVELLQECDTFEELNQAEKDWIAKLDAVHSHEYYNICYGGKNNPAHPLSEEEKEQRRAVMSKRWESEEYREYIRQMLRDKQSNGKSWMIGKRHTEETKAKMSQAQKGHPDYLSHEARLRIVKSRKENGTDISDRYSSKGHIWINNAVVEKNISPDEFPRYESQGFVKGRLKRKRKSCATTIESVDGEKSSIE